MLRKRLFKPLALSILFCITIQPQTSAQTDGVPLPLAPTDYGKWESLGAGVLSPDGKWFAYQINRVNQDNELRVRRLDTEADEVVPYGVSPAFSSNSGWLAYAIGMPEAQKKKLEEQEKPVRNKMGLLNLAAGDTIVVNDVASFRFRDDGGYLVMQRYSRADQENKGVDLVTRDLDTGLEMNFGNISEYAWQEDGMLLAMITDAEGQAGNGVQVFNTETGVLRPLDSNPTRYSGLSWRKQSDDLAVLREQEDDDYETPTHVVLSWRGLNDHMPTQRILDSSTAGLPKDSRIIDGYTPDWSKDGDILFLGIRDREKKTEIPVDSIAAKDSTATEELAPAEVLVWHSKDAQVIPEQKLSAERVRRRNFLVAWHQKDNYLVKLGKELSQPVRPIPGQRYALGADRTPYEFDGMFGRPYQDLYLIDLSSGEWQRIQERIR
ncbi:MAG: S9 family peptidase, partial [Gemmatimonadota bacterium]|nr:S9 family peptidase [Gemmatimonadota bacterium]